MFSFFGGFIGVFLQALNTPLVAPARARATHPQAELESLGRPTTVQDKTQQGGLLLSVLSKFATNFCNALEGRSGEAGGIEMNELYGGARISYIFNEVRAHGGRFLTRAAVAVQACRAPCSARAGWG